MIEKYIRSNQNTPRSRKKKKGNHSRNHSNSSISQSGMISLKEKMEPYTKLPAESVVNGLRAKPKVKKAISELKMPSLE